MNISRVLESFVAALKLKNKDFVKLESGQWSLEVAFIAGVLSPAPTQAAVTPHFRLKALTEDPDIT